MTDINALVSGLMQLALDITKANKAKTGVSGSVQLIMTDPVVLASFQQVVENITKLPADFKALQINDALELIQPVVQGIEAIYAAAKA